MVVHGVANLEGLPLERTEHPVDRTCRITVFQTLWPTNEPSMNTVVVRHGAWTQWPDSWWHFNSQTGVFFFVRTTSLLERLQAEIKSRDDPTSIKAAWNRATLDSLGTNMWTALSRFNDWYEPATNLTAIRQLLATKRMDANKQMPRTPR